MGRFRLCVGAPLFAPSKLSLKNIVQSRSKLLVCEFITFEPSTLFVDFVGYRRYSSAFGSPVARVQGIGYIQELVARLTHTPIETHNSSTNATLNDSPITFPLGQSLYVDATHEVVVLNSRSSFYLVASCSFYSFFSYHGAEFDELCRVWSSTLYSYRP